jgi:hypothetical protein
VKNKYLYNNKIKSGRRFELGLGKFLVVKK